MSTKPYKKLSFMNKFKDENSLCKFHTEILNTSAVIKPFKEE